MENSANQVSSEHEPVVKPIEDEILVTFDDEANSGKDAIIFMTTSSNHYSSARNGDTCCSCTT